MGSVRVPKMWDPNEYREGKIQVSTGKGRIRESTGNGGFWRVPEMWDLGEYQKCGIRASTGKVKFGLVPEKVGSERVSEKVKSG